MITQVKFRDPNTVQLKIGERIFFSEDLTPELYRKLVEHNPRVSEFFTITQAKNVKVKEQPTGDDNSAGK